VGLVARAIEAKGIPTVALSITREITEKTPPPRALFVRFPFGHALGRVGNRDEQLTVLLLAFRLLFEAARPGTIRDAGLRWRRGTYSPPDWEAFRRLGPASASDPGSGGCRAGAFPPAGQNP
jgi:D-proline reductase (dithiol) PrdB